MTKGEINLLYVEVEKLLNDICKFLNEEIGGGHISHNGRSIANKLIERSKKQLQTIAIVTDASDCINEPYVDMQSCKVNQEQDEHQEIYSDVSLTLEGVSSSSQVDEEYIACPYASLPAMEIKEGKTGHLYRKERIFFFEQQKKIYAAVLQSWFLIYINENAVKPCQTFDLTRFEAKPSSTPLKDMKKRDEGFDLINFVNAKSYHFTALTSKDMMQWVAAINRQSDKIVSQRSLPPVPAIKSLNELVSTSTESMNDYEPLKEYQLKQDWDSKESQLGKSQKLPEKQPVPLPPRNTPLAKLQRPTPRVPSEESLSGNYDSVDPGVLNPSQGTPSSFSEDDSDTIYDNPSELKTTQDNLHSNVKPKNGNSISNQDSLEVDDDDEIYDYLQNIPNFTVKSISTNLTNAKPSNAPTIANTKKQSESKLGKSKSILKPKIFPLRHRSKNNV